MQQSYRDDLGGSVRCDTYAPPVKDCTSGSPLARRVERVHLALQDRLVKELRLRGISSQKASNAYAPRCTANFNEPFAKRSKS